MTDALRAHILERICYDAGTGKMTWKTCREKRRVGKEIGKVSGGGYRVVHLRPWGDYFVHRLIWLYVHGRWPEHQIDHINGVKLDNRLLNLREATPSENRTNIPARGIVFHRGANRWQAQITKHGKYVYLGLFSTAEEAHAAYMQEATRMHGPFVRAA